MQNKSAVRLESKCLCALMVLSVRSQIRQISERYIRQPGFLKFAMIQDMVWVNFLVADSKFHYMGKAIIKLIKAPIKAYWR